MTGLAYDDIDTWRFDYPVEVYEGQLVKVVAGLENAVDAVKNASDTETVDMIHATYNTFKSALNQVQFVIARGNSDKARMKEICESEIVIARNQLALMNKNAAIGYEAANHYYYSKGQLAEKIINCSWIIENL